MSLLNIIVFIIVFAIVGTVMDVTNKLTGNALYSFPSKKSYVLTFGIIIGGGLVAYLASALV